jgi:hypothetical protein
VTAAARRIRARDHLTITGVVAALLGLVLFAYTLHRTGVGHVLDLVSSFGLGGFALILLLSGFRLAIRAAAWARCIEPPDRLRFRDAFAAMLMGEALGNMTPFSVVLSEPAKAAFVRHRVPLGAAFPAIVIENVIYSAFVATVIGLGAIAFLLTFPAAERLRVASLVALLVVAVVLLGAYWILGAGAKPASRLIDSLRRRGVGGKGLEASADRVRRFEARINEFVSRNRAQILPLIVLEGLFHLAGIAEVYVTLLLVGGAGAATPLTALILESTGRVINVMFRFVPLRFGVDEAGSEVMARALRLATATGVTLGLVRKARIMVWSAVGVALLLHRGLTLRRALAEAEAAAAADANAQKPRSA